MNIKLLEEIVYHIFANLGILPSTFVNINQTQLLIDRKFLLSEKLTFQNEEGIDITKNIYGTQIVVSNKMLKILLADCSQDKKIPEFACVLQLQDSPMFGMYLIYNKLVDEKNDSEAMIAMNLDKKNWIICNTYLQATLLAGMEQLRDVASVWNCCSSYEEIYSLLLSFIQFHDNYFEVLS